MVLFFYGDTEAIGFCHELKKIDSMQEKFLCLDGILHLLQRSDADILSLGVNFKLKKMAEIQCFICT